MKLHMLMLMLMLMNAWMMLVLMKCKCQMQCLTLGCYNDAQIGRLQAVVYVYVELESRPLLLKPYRSTRWTWEVLAILRL